MKAIVNPLEHAKTAAEAYGSLYGADLVSVILYGSAAGHGFIPERSDINLLIVLTAMDPELIAKSAGLQAKYARMRFGKPLFIDKDYIAHSRDSYPMEFLDMKECYKVLSGEDVLHSIAPAKEHLRLQVERELKGKWLYLLQEFTFARRNKKRLLQLARVSLKAFMPVFRTLLRLNGVPVPSGRNELLTATESACRIAGSPLRDMAESCVTGNRSGLESRFIAYVKALKGIIALIDNQ